MQHQKNCCEPVLRNWHAILRTQHRLGKTMVSRKLFNSLEDFQKTVQARKDDVSKGVFNSLNHEDRASDESTVREGRLYIHKGV